MYQLTCLLMRGLACLQVYLRWAVAWLSLSTRTSTPAA
jgi:hypothetical protein